VQPFNVGYEYTSSHEGGTDGLMHISQRRTDIGV
jgi:hypothetical protein